MKFTKIFLNRRRILKRIESKLIHREYSNAYTAKMITGKDKVVFENANKAHGFGEIDPENFIPFTKNPAIAKVFSGSGTEKRYKKPLQVR